MGTKKFNADVAELYRKDKRGLRHNVDVRICKHLGTEVLTHAGQCLHNMDDSKDAEDVALFKKIINALNN